MFELSVACKYLLPRRRQLSVSIISIISVLVISLVVWLIVVFFSVTNGLEKSWINKLTALTAPVRVTPTEAYYQSYYYQIDSISDASGYNSKTIGEKLDSQDTDPYDPAQDEEIPSFWPPVDLDSQGVPKDLVKGVYSSIQSIKNVPNLKAQDFELTGSQIHINLLRGISTARRAMYVGSTKSSLSYPAYLGNFESDNTNFSKALLPVSLNDINNLLNLSGVAITPSEEEETKRVLFPAEVFQTRLQAFFKQVSVNELRTASQGWTIPPNILPSQFKWIACAIYKDQTLLKVVVPQKASDFKAFLAKLKEEQTLTVLAGTLIRNEDTFLLEIPEKPAITLTTRIPIVLGEDASIPAKLNERSLLSVKKVEDIQFDIQVKVQGALLAGTVIYRGLKIENAAFNQTFSAESSAYPLWLYRLAKNENDPNPLFILPKDKDVGEGVLLPKGFREAGVLIGDRGYLTYFTPTASILQEQRLPVYVAGFYDPGIIPIGAKFLLANKEVISIIRAAHNQDDRIVTNGINIRFRDYDKAEEVKKQLLQSLKEKGLSRYWSIETYREFEFTKEIMRELQSQKHIFTVIALAIIIVACSNIISMLIILVNDKKLEIGILRSMGATSKSIAFIFGMAGALIGIMGSAIGIISAMITLKNLQSIVDFVSRAQGYDLFNTAFYGESIPQELSYEALSFVLIATIVISLLAGIVPAVKACLLKPSSILRSTG